jgi:hypothetical protein
MPPTLNGTGASRPARNDRRWKLRSERIDYAEAATWVLAEERAEVLAKRAGLSLRRIYDLKAGDHTGFVARVVKQVRALPAKGKAALLAWLIQDQVDGLLGDETRDIETLYHVFSRMETARQGALDNVQSLTSGRPLDLHMVEQAEEPLRAQIVVSHLLLAVCRSIRQKAGAQ